MATGPGTSTKALILVLKITRFLPSVIQMFPLGVSNTREGHILRLALNFSPSPPRNRTISLPWTPHTSSPGPVKKRVLTIEESRAGSTLSMESLAGS